MSNVSSRAQGWSDSWLPSGVRHAAGGKEVALSLAYMVLMVFGDLLASSATLTMMQDLVPVEAGQWNFATAKFIATTATDMLGQLLVGYLADRYGRRFAMTANAFSFGLSTLWTALMTGSYDWPFHASVVAPLLRLLGGGAQTATFLVLVPLVDNTDGVARSDLFWLTGAIDNLLQPVASLVSLQLMSKGKAVPYGVAIGCAILNIAVLQLVPVNDMGSELDDFSSEPLLPPSDVTQQHKLRSTQLLATLFPDTAKPPRSGASFLGTNRRLTLAVSIFALAGISKSTRGLFTTYVFKRYHISFSQAQHIFEVRNLIAVVIYAVLLPIILFVTSKYTSLSANDNVLWIARCSMILMGFGALLIGIAMSKQEIWAALIINTFGIAMDLTVLRYVSDSMPRHVAGRSLMGIGSVQCLGTLIGVGVIFPVYQWSISNSGWIAGSPYYICAGVYAVVNILVWNLKQAFA